jgi:hypothetical protein
MKRTNIKSKHRVSHAEVRSVVLEYHRKACQVPPQFDHMIVEIVQAYWQALSLSLGNLELCHRRTLDYAKAGKAAREGKNKHPLSKPAVV